MATINTENSIRLIIQSCATLGRRNRGSFLNAVLFLVGFKININHFPLMENCFSQQEITRKIFLKEKMKKQIQYYLDFEGNSGNSHFGAMCELYFFSILVQMGTFKRYFFLTNKSYLAK